MDIQGAEAMVLDGASGVLKASVCVIVEVGMYNIYKAPACRMSHVHDILLNAGFIFHKFSFLKSHSLRPISAKFSDIPFPKSQAIDGDAVYIKDMRNVEFYNTAALGKLALISDAIFGSPDLTLRCLELLGQRSKDMVALAHDYSRLYQAWSHLRVGG